MAVPNWKTNDIVRFKDNQVKALKDLGRQKVIGMDGAYTIIEGHLSYFHHRFEKVDTLQDSLEEIKNITL